jgi:hypothetical protein
MALSTNRDRTAAAIQQVAAQRLPTGANGVPAPQTPCSRAAGDDPAPTAVSCANGQLRPRRGANGPAATPAPVASDASAAVSHPILRPPLPQRAPAVEACCI